MGSLSNLYISQSYQSLIHLESNTSATTTPTQLQDGIGTNLGIYLNTNGEVSASSFSGSINGIGNVSAFSSSVNSRILAITGSSINTGSLVTTASFNSYTASQDFKNTTFATTGSNVFIGNQTLSGSLFISGNINMVNGSDLITHHVRAAGSNGLELQTSAGTIIVAMGQGGGTQAGFVGSLSSNAFSASTINGLGDPLAFSTSVNSRLIAATGSTINTGSFATTGSNTFTGQQTLSDVDLLNQIGLDDHSGSLVLFAKGFTSSSLTHISASSAGVGNIIFKTNDSTATTIVSGSSNILTNAAAATAGFNRYIGGSGNIMLNASNVPQISSSMTISPTMNNNYFGGNSTTLTMRGPVSSSAWTISGNINNGTINIGQGAILNAQGIQSGLTLTGNTVAGTLNLNAPFTLSSSVSFTNNILNGTATITAYSSSVSFAFNNINDNSFTLNNNFFSSSAGVGSVALNRNNIGGQGQTITIQGSQPAGTNNATSYSDNTILGGSNILFADVSSARVVSTNAYHSAIRNIIGGNQLIVSASSLLSDVSSFGSAYFGRYNANDGIRNKTSDIVFAVGTGTSTTRKTGFLIDSGSNTFIEGTLNVSGSTTMTGSLILSSSAAVELQVIGALEITGSVAGNITALTVASSTASIDFNLGTFFTLTIPSSSVTYITGSNLKPGMTANIVLTQEATTGSVRFESSLFKFPSGSINTGSAVASAVDIVSVMSVNTTTLLSVGANRLI